MFVQLMLQQYTTLMFPLLFPTVQYSRQYKRWGYCLFRSLQISVYAIAILAC